MCSHASVCVLTERLLCCLCVCKGGTSLGDTEEPTGHELRQAEPLAALLLREGNHAEGKRKKKVIRLDLLCEYV